MGLRQRQMHFVGNLRCSQPLVVKQPNASHGDTGARDERTPFAVASASFDKARQIDEPFENRHVQIVQQARALELLSIVL